MFFYYYIIAIKHNKKSFDNINLSRWIESLKKIHVKQNIQYYNPEINIILVQSHSDLKNMLSYFESLSNCIIGIDTESSLAELNLENNLATIQLATKEKTFVILNAFKNKDERSSIKKY